MKVFQLNCGKCKRPLSFPLPEATVHSPCPACGADIQVGAFPALLKGSAQGKATETPLAADESSCFYHPTRKAEAPCEACGRFLCSLCDVEFNERRLCPTCIEKGAEKGALERLQKKSVRYDELALFLAVAPMLFYCITIITAPAALFIAIRHWNSPMSIVRKNRWRFVLAILIAGLQMLAWGLFGTWQFFSSE